MGRSGSSVACLSGPAPGITATMGLVFTEPTLITVDGMDVDGMVHTVSLILAMPTFTRIAAQLPTRRLAADSGAVPVVSAAAAYVASRLEGV